MPPKSKKKKCGQCSGQLKARGAENVIQCSQCKKWIHEICSLLSSADFQAHCSDENLPWLCPTCSGPCGPQPPSPSSSTQSRPSSRRGGGGTGPGPGQELEGAGSSGGGGGGVQVFNPEDNTTFASLGGGQGMSTIMSLGQVFSVHKNYGKKVFLLGI